MITAAIPAHPNNPPQMIVGRIEGSSFRIGLRRMLAVASDLPKHAAELRPMTPGKLQHDRRFNCSCQARQEPFCPLGLRSGQPIIPFGRHFSWRFCGRTGDRTCTPFWRNRYSALRLRDLPTVPRCILVALNGSNWRCMTPICHNSFPCSRDCPMRFGMQSWHSMLRKFTSNHELMNHFWRNSPSPPVAVCSLLPSCDRAARVQ